MFSERAAQDLIGRTVIVGLAHADREGNILSREQYRGRITRANRREGVVIQTPSGAEKTLPPDLRASFGARAGYYRLKGTGEVIDNPDLQTRWTITSRQSDAPPS